MERSGSIRRRGTLRRTRPVRSISHADRIISATVRGERTRPGPEEPRMRWRRKSKPTDAERALWRSAMLGLCESTSCMVPLAMVLGQREQHHVIERQHVRSLGGDEWDPRNSMTLCRGCHARHTNAERRLLVADIPDAALEFARELMGGPAAYAYISRRYRGYDSRLDGLLA